MTFPAQGSKWKHYNNGQVYIVMYVANIGAVGSHNEHEFPITIVYRDKNARIWAREYSKRWIGKFEPVPQVKCENGDCGDYRNFNGGCDLCGAPCL